MVLFADWKVLSQYQTDFDLCASVLTPFLNEIQSSNSQVTYVICIAQLLYELFYL